MYGSRVAEAAPVIARGTALFMEVEADHIKARLHPGKALCLLVEGPAQDALAAMLVGQVYGHYVLQIDLPPLGMNLVLDDSQ
jgi:hypothetical protein